MSNSTISTLRLLNQQVIGSHFEKPEDLVKWMGAMQAQDYAMAKWAVGIRIPGSTDAHIEAAIDQGKIIRTHLMRPTWHFVAALDLTWMLDLTAPYIFTGMRSRHKQLEITDALIKKSTKIFTKALAIGPCTRQELVDLLVKAKIPLDDNRAAHLLFCAELNKVICSGARKGNQLTYALLDQRVSISQSYTKEEALGKLAKGYFTSHGPATLLDFVWWSGLPLKEARVAIELVKSDFKSLKSGDQTYLYKEADRIPEVPIGTCFLLPAYDEFLISYKDRSPSLSSQKQGVTISTNGIFYPLIVIDGLVAGTWRRTKKGAQVLIEAQYFKKPTALVKRRFEEEAHRFGVYLHSQVRIV